jgi:tRNA (guanine10-N2)-dimethyltransferase
VVEEGEPFDMTRLFFLVSGEHESLPFAEIRAILEAQNTSFTETSIFPRVLCLDSEIQNGWLVANKSSMTKICGLELFRCEMDEKKIHTCLKEVPYDDYVMEGQSFAVRVKAVGPSRINTMDLEKEIGSTIFNRVKSPRVDLVKPDRFFLGLLINTTLIFGVKLVEVNSRQFMDRSPNKRPFRHPSTMSPRLARCMVNLARGKPGSWVLDPFCGAGSMLIEAGCLGYCILGSDIKVKMVKGSVLNLRYYEIPFNGLIVSDARSLPFERVNCIITDTPYGRAASTLGLSPKTLITEFLSNARSILLKGGYIVLGLANDSMWKEIALNLGYDFIEQYYVREHKNLTREILIIKKS